MPKRKQTRSKRGQDSGEPFEPASKTLTVSGAGKKYTQHSFICASPGIAFSVQGAVYPFGTTLAGKFFSLNQIGNYGNLTNLYDQFRIDTVEVTAMLRTTSAAVTAYPRLCYFPDFDDATAPPSEAAVFMHPRVKIHQFTLTSPVVKFSFKPLVASSAYGGGAFNGYYAPNGPVFVDSNSPGTEHYGFKYSLENNLDTSVYVDFYYKFWLTMRNPI